MASEKYISKSTPRNSSIELLRIIAMLAIVVSHASLHSCFPERPSVLALNNHFLNWMVLGNLGVNIFVLITGYFSCTKPMNTNGILKNLTEVWFYSLFCGLLYVLSGGSVSERQLLIIFFPTIFKEYWFFTAYFALMLISPYLNIFIKNATKKQFENCLLTMIILWCVIFSFTNQDMYSSKIILFFLYYFIGAYIRMYPDTFLASKHIRNGLAAISMGLLFLSSTVIRLVNENIVYLISETSFTNSFSIISLAASVGLFSVFAYHKAWTNSFVNKLASCTFGIYLIHSNPFWSEIIWLDWIKLDAWYDSIFLVLRVLLSSVIVFAVCLIIELLRQAVIEKPYLYFSKKVLNSICKKCDAIRNRLFERNK